MLVATLPPWNERDIEQQLMYGEVRSLISMDRFLAGRNKIADYTNEVYAAHLPNGAIGVFKPEEHNESWDMGSADAEVAAYRASCQLGFDCVPPTVVRVIQGRRGSMQLYLESEYDSCDKTHFKYCVQNADTDSLATLKIFDFIFGQWDRRLSNIIFLQASDSIRAYGVDNTKVFSAQHSKFGDRPFVSILKHISLAKKGESPVFPFHQSREMVVQGRRSLDRNFGAAAGAKLASIYSGCQGMRIRYVIWQGQVWQQPFSFDPVEERSIKPFSDHLPCRVAQSLARIDTDTLLNIFPQGLGKGRFNRRSLQAVLARLDQVQKHFKWKMTLEATRGERVEEHA